MYLASSRRLPVRSLGRILSNLTTSTFILGRLVLDKEKLGASLWLTIAMLRLLHYYFKEKCL